MASNLSTIGFTFKNNDEFSQKMVELAGETAKEALCSAGHYALWSEPSGVQLWFHLAREVKIEGEEIEIDIQGLTPFFEGKSKVAAKLTTAIRRDDDNPFEGGFYAWINPDETGEGAYPMVFDAVDFAMHTKRKLPFNATIRLSGFARELTAYPSPAAYESASSDRPKLAVKAFIPMGLFAATAAQGEADAANNTDDTDKPSKSDGNGHSKKGLGDIIGTPSPTALLTGIVTAHHILRNENTRRKFHWLSVDSLEASFDIVADPGVITGDIVKGGIVEVACWFFGRILD